MAGARVQGLSLSVFLLVRVKNFKPGACHIWFLEIDFVHDVGSYVCMPAPRL